MKLNPSEDLEIDSTDLQAEFKKLPRTIHAYCEQKADAEREYDRLKFLLEEVRAKVYKDLRGSGVKHTEKSLEAELDCHPDVLAVQDMMLTAKRELATWIGGVESLRAKKDCLIQLGADARAENK